MNRSIYGETEMVPKELVVAYFKDEHYRSWIGISTDYKRGGVSITLTEVVQRRVRWKDDNELW